MGKILKILKNRDFLLLFSIVLGLAWNDGAKVVEKAVLPMLALVMTLAVMGVPGSVFPLSESLDRPGAVGDPPKLWNFGRLALGVEPCPYPG